MADRLAELVEVRLASAGVALVSWMLPEADVSIFLLVTTWVPISITRKFPPGGVPVAQAPL